MELDGGTKQLFLYLMDLLKAFDKVQRGPLILAYEQHSKFPLGPLAARGRGSTGKSLRKSPEGDF